jgi:hypothetical protein
VAALNVVSRGQGLQRANVMQCADELFHGRRRVRFFLGEQSAAVRAHTLDESMGDRLPRGRHRETDGLPGTNEVDLVINQDDHGILFQAK